MTTQVDTTTPVTFTADALDQPCEHFEGLSPVVPSANGCEDCLAIGSAWVHLRLCLGCGHAGCCDSSPHRHASAHAAAVRHAVVTSLEPGESWGYCYLDDLAVGSV